jgi:hypothetical protein
LFLSSFSVYSYLFVCWSFNSPLIVFRFRWNATLYRWILTMYFRPYYIAFIFRWKLLHYRNYYLFRIRIRWMKWDQFVDYGSLLLFDDYLWYAHQYCLLTFFHVLPTMILLYKLLIIFSFCNCIIMFLFGKDLHLSFCLFVIWARVRVRYSQG